MQWRILNGKIQGPKKLNNKVSSYIVYYCVLEFIRLVSFCVTNLYPCAMNGLTKLKFYFLKIYIFFNFQDL